MSDRQQAQCPICKMPARYEHECPRSDIPIPPEANLPSTIRRPPSAWPYFMERWKVGESVLVSWTAMQSLKTYAKNFGYKVHWEAQRGKLLDGLTAARVWRIA